MAHESLQISIVRFAGRVSKHLRLLEIAQSIITRKTDPFITLI
jgi:hypothetical protein